MERERETAAGPHAPHHPIPPEQRRRWLIGTVIGLVVTVLAITGGPWVYARVMDSAAQDPLELTTPSPQASVDPDAPIEADGSWMVAAGSQAGYRIGEVLTGDEVEVVGRTDQVTGTVEIAGGQLSSARLVVSTASIATDQSARDLYFRRALDTSTYPEATFELTEPVDVSTIGSAEGPVTVQVPGTLTIGASAVAVTAELQVQRNNGRFEVAGTIPITLADFGLTAPDLGFVTVDPTGAVEVLLLLEEP